MTFKHVNQLTPGVLFGIGMALLPSAFAACKPGLKTPAFPFIQGLRGPVMIEDLNTALPIGSTLANVPINETVQFQVACMPDRIHSWRISLSGASVGPGLVSSGIAGIGLGVIRSNGNPLPVDVPLSAQIVDYFPSTYRLRLVKIGDIPQGGSITGDLYQFQQTNPGNFLIATARLSAPITVKLRRSPTCVVDTRDIDVTFPPVPIDTLLNPLLATSEFAIRLNCSGGTTGITTPVRLGLTDAVTPGNMSEVLGLSPASTAAGVGIRVLYAGTPIRFGPPTGNGGLPVGAANNGIFSIPLRAELVSTGTLKGGSFSASSIFTIDYM